MESSFFLVRDGGINRLHSSKALLSSLTVNFGSNKLNFDLHSLFLAFSKCSRNLSTGTDRSITGAGHASTSNLFDGCLQVAKKDLAEDEAGLVAEQYQSQVIHTQRVLCICEWKHLHCACLCMHNSAGSNVKSIGSNFCELIRLLHLDESQFLCTNW